MNLFYKEWLKLRNVCIPAFVVALLVVIYQLFIIKNRALLNGSGPDWYATFLAKKTTPIFLSYIPVLLGVVFGIFQFWPETNQRKIRLSLQLPMNNLKILIQMILFGSGCYSLVVIISYSLFLIGNVMYYPVEYVHHLFITLIPLFLGGLNAYVLSAVVVMEPRFTYKINLLILGTFIVMFNYYSPINGSYLYVLKYQPILSAFSLILYFNTANRLQKLSAQ